MATTDDDEELRLQLLADLLTARLLAAWRRSVLELEAACAISEGRGSDATGLSATSSDDGDGG